MNPVYYRLFSLLFLLNAGYLISGCSYVCTNPDDAYTQNSQQCSRFCADQACKYWGHSKEEAEVALAEGLRLQDDEIKRSCVSMGLTPNTKEMTSCLRDQEKAHAAEQLKNSAKGNYPSDTYYLEK